jgi:hypothetical protein
VTTLLAIGIIGAAGLAGLVGYLVHRWSLLMAIAGSGALLISVDVATRDLTSAGHDDRGLVAAAEVVLLLVLEAFAAIGTGLAKRRRARTRSGPIESRNTATGF